MGDCNYEWDYTSRNVQKDYKGIHMESPVYILHYYKSHTATLIKVNSSLSNRYKRQFMVGCGGDGRHPSRKTKTHHLNNSPLSDMITQLEREREKKINERVVVFKKCFFF